MIRPDQITAFMESNSRARIELIYEGADRKVYIKQCKEKITGFIPKERAPDIAFKIEEALSHPQCGASYSIIDSEYRVVILERHQIWSVMKIALNHLNWHQEDKLCVNIVYE
jgi:hypothetical protein